MDFGMKVLITLAVAAVAAALVVVAFGAVDYFFVTQSAQPKNDGLADYLVLQRCGTRGKYGDPGMYRTLDDNPDHLADAIELFLQKHQNLQVSSHDSRYVGRYYTIYFDYKESGGG